MNTELHVKYRADDSSWILERKDAKRASKVCDKKSEAVDEAERFLQEKDNVTQIVIHKRNGDVSKRKKLNKKKQKLKSVSMSDRIYMKDLDVSGYKLKYTAWKDDYWKPMSDNDVGDRVQIAGNSTTEQTELYAVIPEGEEGWPDGGYIVKGRHEDYYTKHFKDEVILHKHIR